ncbi:uncharacterized protein V6R79_018038 [Siganus canaliculatus]
MESPLHQRCATLFNRCTYRLYVSSDQAKTRECARIKNVFDLCKESMRQILHSHASGLRRVPLVVFVVVVVFLQTNLVLNTAQR